MHTTVHKIEYIRNTIIHCSFSMSFFSTISMERKIVPHFSSSHSNKFHSSSYKQFLVAFTFHMIVYIEYGDTQMEMVMLLLHSLESKSCGLSLGVLLYLPLSLCGVLRAPSHVMLNAYHLPNLRTWNCGSLTENANTLPLIRIEERKIAVSKCPVLLS